MIILLAFHPCSKGLVGRECEEDWKAQTERRHLVEIAEKEDLTRFAECCFALLRLFLLHASHAQRSEGRLVRMCREQSQCRQSQETASAL